MALSWSLNAQSDIIFQNEKKKLVWYCNLHKMWLYICYWSCCHLYIIIIIHSQISSVYTWVNTVCMCLRIGRCQNCIRLIFVSVVKGNNTLVLQHSLRDIYSLHSSACTLKSLCSIYSYLLMISPHFNPSTCTTLVKWLILAFDNVFSLR